MFKIEGIMRDDALGSRDEASRPPGEDDGKDDGENDKDEDGERDQATSRPLDLRPAHALDELLALCLRLRERPLLRCAEGREQDEGAGDPEQREDYGGSL